MLAFTSPGIDPALDGSRPMLLFAVFACCYGREGVEEDESCPAVFAYSGQSLVFTIGRSQCKN